MVRKWAPAFGNHAWGLVGKRKTQRMESERERERKWDWLEVFPFLVFFHFLTGHHLQNLLPFVFCQVAEIEAFHICCAASGPSSRVRPAAKAGPPSTPSLKMGRRGRGPWSPCRSRNQCGEWIGERLPQPRRPSLRLHWWRHGAGASKGLTTPARIVFENTLDGF